MSANSADWQVPDNQFLLFRTLNLNSRHHLRSWGFSSSTSTPIRITFKYGYKYSFSSIYIPNQLVFLILIFSESVVPLLFLINISSLLIPRAHLIFFILLDVHIQKLQSCPFIFFLKSTFCSRVQHTPHIQLDQYFSQNKFILLQSKRLFNLRVSLDMSCSKMRYLSTWSISRFFILTFMFSLVVNSHNFNFSHFDFPASLLRF